MPNPFVATNSASKIKTHAKLSGLCCFILSAFLVGGCAGNTHKHASVRSTLRGPIDGISPGTPNHVGAQPTFEYQESPGVVRYAFPMTSEIHSPNFPWAGTNDPNWMVGHPNDANWHGLPEGFEWLTYLGTDGSMWKAKIHCKYVNIAPIGVSAYIENKKADDSDGHDNPGLQVVDGRGQKWDVQILGFDGNGPLHPSFYLTRVRAGSPGKFGPHSKLHRQHGKNAPLH